MCFFDNNNSKIIYFRINKMNYEDYEDNSQQNYNEYNQDGNEIDEEIYSNEDETTNYWWVKWVIGFGLLGLLFLAYWITNKNKAKDCVGRWSNSSCDPISGKMKMKFAVSDKEENGGECLKRGKVKYVENNECQLESIRKGTFVPTSSELFTEEEIDSQEDEKRRIDIIKQQKNKSL